MSCHVLWSADERRAERSRIADRLAHGHGRPWLKACEVLGVEGVADQGDTPVGPGDLGLRHDRAIGADEIEPDVVELRHRYAGGAQGRDAIRVELGGERFPGLGAHGRRRRRRLGPSSLRLDATQQVGVGAYGEPAIVDRDRIGQELREGRQPEERPPPWQERLGRHALGLLEGERQEQRLRIRRGPESGRDQPPDPGPVRLIGQPAGGEQGARAERPG